MQPASESAIKTIDFGEINFAAHFVAYEKFQRFGKINVSQNSFFCPTRTITPSRWPFDFRVFSQTHTDSPLRKFTTPIEVRLDSPGIQKNHEFKHLIKLSQRIDPIFVLLRGSFEIF
jgi:hypothetical protein